MASTTAMRVATWNLERTTPSRKKRQLGAQLGQIAEVDADVWIFTETHQEVSPGSGYEGCWLPPHENHPGESYVAVWSRTAIAVAASPDPRGSLPVHCETPLGPLTVHGVVIPYHGDKGAGSGTKAWGVHYQWTEQLQDRWIQLRERYPGAGLLVAGDFNEAFGRPGYGTKHGRELLGRALGAAELRCLTKDVTIDGRHVIDHVALSADWADRLEVSVGSWHKTRPDGFKLSDHHGVHVGLRQPPSR